jgi:hypothetical protein
MQCIGNLICPDQPWTLFLISSNTSSIVLAANSSPHQPPPQKEREREERKGRTTPSLSPTTIITFLSPFVRQFRKTCPGIISDMRTVGTESGQDVMVGILEVLCSFNMLVRILERERKGTDAFAGSYFCVEVEVGTEEVACESGSSVVGRSGRKGRRTDGPDPFWTLMIVPSLCYTPVVRVIRIIIEPYSPTVS